MARELSHAKKLERRMKDYEADFEDSISSETPAILRCDGHSFSRMSDTFNKPFDERYHNAMVETAKDLLKEFPSATIAYTASDEITLVFPNGLNTFNNRIQKISSVASGLASVRFYVNMMQQIEEHKDNPDIKPIKQYGIQLISHAHFDGRVYAVPDVEEAVNCLIWRCRGDAMRNAVNAFARIHFNKRQLLKKHTGEVRDMLMRQKGLVFEECVPPWAVAGTLVKREMVEIEGLNPITGKTEKAFRTRMKEVDRGMTKLDEEAIHLVVSKYWGSAPRVAPTIGAVVKDDAKADVEDAAKNDEPMNDEYQDDKRDDSAEIEHDQTSHG
jgi:tRNA(His) guanylyltransferase